MRVNTKVLGWTDVCKIIESIATNENLRNDERVQIIQDLISELSSE